LGVPERLLSERGISAPAVAAVHMDVSPDLNEAAEALSADLGVDLMHLPLDTLRQVGVQRY
jgi:hypothetical protein